jgi:hypothetical protein
MWLNFMGPRSPKALAYCEVDKALGLTSAIDSELRDNRTPKEHAAQHCSDSQYTANWLVMTTPMI